jgi:hypothetical protein
VLREPLLYLSLHFKQHRAIYYELLNRVRHEGDWEAWLAFFLDGVRETADGAVAPRSGWPRCSGRIGSRSSRKARRRSGGRS